MQDVLAGNALRFTRRFDRAEGVVTSVNPSTAKMAVTAPDGATTALITSVTFDGDTAVIVVATWTIADTASRGVYVITTDVDGSMVASHEEAIGVIARTTAALP